MACANPFDQNINTDDINPDDELDMFGWFINHEKDRYPEKLEKFVIDTVNRHVLEYEARFKTDPQKYPLISPEQALNNLINVYNSFTKESKLSS